MSKKYLMDNRGARRRLTGVYVIFDYEHRAAGALQTSLQPQILYRAQAQVPFFRVCSPEYLRYSAVELWP